jgi:hypothetical protein
MDWHLRNGFVELPNYFTARHRSNHYSLLYERYRSRQQLEQAAEMLRLAEHWAEVAERITPTSDLWATQEFMPPN